MTTLPSWWTWEPAGGYDTPLLATRVVFGEHGEIAAQVLSYESTGTWSLRIDDGELRCECGGFASEAAAMRACERVWMAVNGVLDEEGGEDG